MAVDLVAIQTVDHLNRIFQLNNHDFSVSSNFKQAVSALTRSGHARFRRGPPSDPHAPSVSSQSEHNQPKEESVMNATASFQLLTSSFSRDSPPVESTAVDNNCFTKKSVTNKSVEVVTDATASFQSMTSSFVGGSVEGSVSNGRQLCSLGVVAPAPSFSSRKPPLPSSHRKRNGTDTVSASLQGSRTACHCCKRRKTSSKREVKRIPIIGSKVESIPADEYSWKKYGEKNVGGSQFPRVYYKCNSVKGCPARKRVELSVTDSKMLVVTYDGEHRHHHRHRHTPTPLPA